MIERNEKWEQFMKEAILEGVVNVLIKDGSEGLTMQRVAEEAGVAKGTLYTYFDNKSTLLKAVLRSSIEPLIQEVDKILGSDFDPAEKLQQIIERTLSYFDENRDMFRVLMHERHKVLGRQPRQKSSHYQHLVAGIASVISQGIESGQFRNRDPQKIATMLVGAIFFMVHNRLFSDNPGDLRGDWELIQEILFQGITQPAE